MSDTAAFESREAKLKKGSRIKSRNSSPQVHLNLRRQTQKRKIPHG
jgi:hypothetical protein